MSWKEKSIFFRIEEKRRYADGEVLKNHLQEFDLIFDHLKPLDKQRLLHIFLREIVFSVDRIKISLWDTHNRLISSRNINNQLVR